jgi:hypothetical protein
LKIGKLDLYLLPKDARIDICLLQGGRYSRISRVFTFHFGVVKICDFASNLFTVCWCGYLTRLSERLLNYSVILHKERILSLRHCLYKK